MHFNPPALHGDESSASHSSHSNPREAHWAPRGDADKVAKKNKKTLAPTEN
jgi:hypothetical protein